VLLDNGASLIQPGRSGTVLHIAASNSRIQVLRALLREYHDKVAEQSVIELMDTEDNTPLMCAVLSPTCVDELIHAKANINFRDPRSDASRTALAVAIENDLLNMAPALHLLNRGANPFCRGDPKYQMWSFLNEFIYVCSLTSALKVKLLSFLRAAKHWIDQYHLLTVRTLLGQTILQSAVHFGQINAVKSLVEIGAPVEDHIGTMKRGDWSREDIVDLFHSGRVEGMDLLTYAKFLRKLHGKKRAAWLYSSRHTITVEEMDEIVEYLSDLPYFKTL